RLLITAGLFGLAFAVIALRLVDVALVRPGGESRLAQQRLEPKSAGLGRADIVDRNGVLLATTLATPSLYANPKQVLEPADAAAKLASIFPDLSESEVLAKLASEKSFVWIKRHLTPEQQGAVIRLGVPGLEFEREERRIYPKGALAAHVVGYSG